MVIDASSGVLLAILVLFIVGTLVILIWLANYIAGPSTKEKRGKRPSIQFTLESSEKPLELLTTAGNVNGRRSLSMGEREIMRVLRDEDTGAIIVEIEGNKYRRLTEIRDGKTGSQVLEAIADLVKFTGGIVRGQWAATSVTPAAPALESPPQPQMVGPANPPGTMGPSGSVEEEGLLRRLREGDLQIGPTPPKETRPGIAGLFRRQRPQVTTEGTGAGGTFIDQIETVLQRMIKSAPTPLSEEVHVGTAPEGGLKIQVGGQYFSSADEVPDPAIRDLIKAAVKEWERS